MATTTPMQGLRVPEQTDDPDVVDDINKLANDIEKRLMGVYASVADRDAKVTSPQEGQFAFLKDTDTVTVYNGTGWTDYPVKQTAITWGSGAPSNSSGSNGDVYFRV